MQCSCKGYAKSEECVPSYTFMFLQRRSYSTLFVYSMHLMRASTKLKVITFLCTFGFRGGEQSFGFHQ